ncbi:metallophosphoesterase [Mycolicibacterium sp. 018/SC-01/001]|uniref:metallophosphoesterase n=1 Tax=Mycolicibacterium sp. 018/SC-01/001 TaxID=2592069 RepID=UPI00117F6AF0|nr:metallophosphoesterase [Mycolicibacterium sp. 018/SC-01/001]TRW79825.1 metallophosphoesterase [Mycolicibacterium sp. 018/SC-01/001]
MFLLVLGSILGLMTAYVWFRLVRSTTRRGRTRRLLTALLLILTALLVAALMLRRDPTGWSWVAWPGYLWFGLLVYLVLALIVLEPFRLLVRIVRRRRASGDDEPDLDRRLFLARASAVAAGAAAVGVTGVGVATALGPPDVLRVPVRLPRLGAQFDGYRIAVVSDIHLGSLLGRRHTERIVRMINETEPDLVAVVGDLVDGTVAQLGPAAAPLADLVSRDGTFFVTGNHEYFVDDTAEWLRELDGLGVQVLRNENTRIRRGAAAFDLAGVNDIAGRSAHDPPDFDRALRGVDAATPTILLAHQPIQVAEAAQRDVDLQLSGHTHGGQMWPFHYAVELAQPALAGLSTVDGTQLYVSRGAGFWGPPVRVGAPPDISILTLGR